MSVAVLGARVDGGVDFDDGNVFDVFDGLATG